MRRREFITLLSGAAAAWPGVARAQQAERMRRIGVLNGIAMNDPDAQARVAAFENALNDVGWAVGRNIRIDYHWGAIDVAGTRTLAKELVGTKPDAILGVTTLVTKELRAETADIPIVFIQVVDPVGTGLVASLARPGGNVTGFTNFEFSMGGKWLELLKEMAPRVTRVAVLFNPTTAPGAGSFYLRSIETAAPSFAINSNPAPARNVSELQDTLAALARDPDAGIVVIPEIFTTNNRELITSLAARHRLPAVYPFKYFATAGGLISYGVDTIDLFRRSASYVDRVLRGAKPGDLPVQQPTKFELVINSTTAKALGLEVSPMLLARADEVIE